MFKTGAINIYTTYHLVRHDTNETLCRFDTLYEARKALRDYLTIDLAADEMQVSIMETTVKDILGFITKERNFFWSSPRLSEDQEADFRQFIDDFKRSLDDDLISADDFKAHCSDNH